MMMTTNLRFCRKCHEILEELGEPLLSYYVDICGYHSQGLVVCAKGGKAGKGDTLTHYLEVLGYICTSEVDGENLQVIPIGYKQEDDFHIFCCKNGKHSNDE